MCIPKKSAVPLFAMAALSLQLVANGCGAAEAAPAMQSPNFGWAPRHADIARTMVLGAVFAGQRIVAVGESGSIMLSDDGGKTFRQARSVPTDSTLTSVTFVDDKHGWAAGHQGVILRTDDGGETWVRQRVDTSVDQPLFSIAFRDTEHGWAVGLWSLMLSTNDGGKTWNVHEVGKGKALDTGGINLYSIFLGAKHGIFITGEKGTVIRSMDDGKSWAVSSTGYNGSLWSGVEAGDASVYVGGLQGHIFRSTDRGMTWQAVKSDGASSITSLLATADGIIGVGLDGLVVGKRNGEEVFKARHIDGRPSITAVTVNPRGHEVLFSKDGVLSAAATNSK